MGADGACNGRCSEYKAKTKPACGRYASGQRRCQTCSVFMNYEGLWCPCCGYRLRTKPRATKAKERYHLVTSSGARAI